MKRRVDLWCTWLFQSMEHLESSIQMGFDIDCCQGILFSERDGERMESRYPLPVSFPVSANRREPVSTESLRIADLRLADGRMSCDPRAPSQLSLLPSLSPLVGPQFSAEWPVFHEQYYNSIEAQLHCWLFPSEFLSRRRRLSF